MPKPKRDIILVAQFLKRLNSDRDTDYRITEQPDEIDRKNKAVEAIARDSSGNSIAIEHTLIQPFVGDKRDTQPFLTVFANLESDPSFVLPEHYIRVGIPVGGIQKGPEWIDLRDELHVWFQDTKGHLPSGTTKHTFSKNHPELTISVWKTHMPGFPGKVSVHRSNMPADFAEVIKTALASKVAKLSATAASERILLLERDSPPHADSEIAEIIEESVDAFPELRMVDAIWVIDTVAWETDAYVDFTPVWPEKLRGYPL
jgi:hypothetical protein